MGLLPGHRQQALEGFNDGTQQTQINGNTTASRPFVVNGWVYFQGTDNKLWKVQTNGTQQAQINDNTTASTPYVTADGWVYFQGTDNKLWKVFNDGSQQAQINNNTTAAPPFVGSDGFVYFKGTDNTLWKVFNDGSQQTQINGNTTSSTPFYINGWVYFQGTDNKLWKVYSLWNGGWGCGYSNGEGLSRFCAEQETPPNTLNGFETGPAWAGAGFPDWVSKTEQTDRDGVSTG